MALSRNKSLWVAAESAFATDPDSDGSDYKFCIGALEIGDLKDNGADMFKAMVDACNSGNSQAIHYGSLAAVGGLQPAVQRALADEIGEEEGV